MSSVSSSSDSGLAHYYHEALTELQGNMDREAKRNAKNREEEVAALDGRYKEALRRKDEETHQAMDELRKDSSETLGRERERHNAAIQELKDQTYNHRGVSIGGLAGADSGLGHYYHKVLNDLEKEIKDEAKRNEKNREEEVSSLEERYKEALRQKELEASKTIKEVKKDGAETLTRERERHQVAINELEDESRNHRGVSIGGLAGAESGLGHYYHKVMGDLEKEMQAERTRHMEAEDEQATRLADGYRASSLKAENDATQAINNIKKSAAEAISNEREKYQGDLEEYQARTYNKRGELSNTVPMNVYKYEVDGMEDAMKKQRETNNRNTDDLIDAQNSNIQEITRQTDNRIKNLTESQNEQIRDYDQRNKDLNAFTLKAEKEKSQQLADLVRDHENQQRSELRRANQAYNSHLDKMQQTLDEREHYYQRNDIERLKQKEAYYAGVIKDQNEKHREEQKGLEDVYTSQMNQLMKQIDRNEKKADEHLGSALEEANAQRQVALESQAKSYEDTINRNRESNQAEMEQLQKVIKKQRAPDENNLPPPGLEDNIRKSMTKEYEKKLNTEVEKDKLTTDHMQRKYVDQYQQALEEYQDRETQLNQEHNRDTAFERSEYLNSIHDTEQQAADHIRQQDTEFDKEKENLFRKFNNAMERQRKDMDHAYESSRAEAESRLVSTIQEGNVRARLAQRAASGRQNELIRDYEKKLADQKLEYEFMIDDLKTQARLDLRDAERRSKQDLQSQMASYEQRIAEIQLQNKEHERYVAQGYQDELDKTRRSYELLSKKKS